MRALVVDDTTVYRRALADALSDEPSIDSVATAADVDTALELLNESAAAPTIVLVNMSIPGSVTVLNSIIRAAPTARVIALAVSALEDDIIACVEAGVTGCLLRDDSYADLVALISRVARGETWFSPPVVTALLHRVATLSGQPRPAPADILLTAREREVMQLVDEGLSNKQIARRLSIELRTVKNHVHHILVKYQVHHRADAAALYRLVRQRGDAQHRAGNGVLSYTDVTA